MTPWHYGRVQRSSDRDDGVVVVGAAVGRPHDRVGADGGVARAVQGGAGAAVDDLEVPAADVGEAPLLVVPAVPRRLQAGGAVGRVAEAVGDHSVGAVDDPVPTPTQWHELPLQVRAAIPGPL